MVLRYHLPRKHPWLQNLEYKTTPIALITAIILVITASIIMLILLISLKSYETMPTLIVKNCKIWTGDETKPSAEAFAVYQDKIIFVGTTMDLEAKFQIPNDTRVIDCSTNPIYAFVMPGFIDSHIHVYSGAIATTGVNQRGANTPQEFVDRVRDYMKGVTDPNEWILGGRWNHLNWGGYPEPNKTWIDHITGSNPTYLRREDGHMALVNSKALQLANITRYTSDIPGGTIDRDPNGEPTGLLRDAAQDLVEQIIPSFAPEHEDRIMEEAIDILIKKGITFVEDMGTGNEYIAFKRLRDQNKLKIRVRSSFGLKDWGKLRDLVKSQQTSSSSEKWLFIGVLKGFSDGSTGSHTAYHFDPYIDMPVNDPLNRGFLLTSEEDMYKFIKAADLAGLQVAIHACGDRANRIVLDVFAKVTNENPPKDRRFRIEHSESVRTQDLLDFKANKIIASMQPMHLLDDIKWADKVLGPVRIYEMYRFGSLLNNSAGLVLGSDWPVATADPIEGIYAAVTRISTNYPNGFNIEERLSIDQTLRGYTVEASKAAFMENKFGRIKEGLWADFVVLDHNLLQVSWAELKNTKIAVTVIDGKVAYEKPRL
jgi:predicted amidohydrolase YtcJ